MPRRVAGKCCQPVEEVGVKAAAGWVLQSLTMSKPQMLGLRREMSLHHVHRVGEHLGGSQAALVGEHFGGALHLSVS